MALTTEEAEQCRQLGRWFYGMEPSNVNDELANVLSEMLAKTLEGSRMMHLVPRPPAGVPGIAWLASQGVQAWFRSQRDNRVYAIVKQTVAAGYRSSYQIAELGL